MAFLIFVILSVGSAFSGLTRSPFNNNNSAETVKPPIYTYHEIMDGGRKKIYEVEEGAQPPAGAQPYPNFSAIFGTNAQMSQQNREVNNRGPQQKIEASEQQLPYANLPATPGINVPLPRQTVQRSGLPLMPLGGRH